MPLTARHVRDSRTTQVQIVMSEHINGSGRLFGGRLMEWIDVVAGVTARRHAHCNVSTVCVDELVFKAPAFVNDTLVLIGQVTSVGHTSLEVRVDTFIESMDGGKRLANRAYLVMVALDDAGNPTPVPELLCDTLEEIAEQQAGQRRRALRTSRPSV